MVSGYTRVLEKFEDSKGVIRGPKSKKDRQYNGQKKKDRQYNGQKKKDKKTSNSLQNNTQKTKDWATWSQLKTRDELRFSGKETSSCSTGGTRRITLVKNPMTSHEWRKNGIVIYVKRLTSTKCSRKKW